MIDSEEIRSPQPQVGLELQGVDGSRHGSQSSLEMSFEERTHIVPESAAHNAAGSQWRRQTSFEEAKSPQPQAVLEPQLAMGNPVGTHPRLPTTVDEAGSPQPLPFLQPPPLLEPRSAVGHASGSQARMSLGHATVAHIVGPHPARLPIASESLRSPRSALARPSIDGQTFGTHPQRLLASDEVRSPRARLPKDGHRFPVAVVEARSPRSPRGRTLFGRPSVAPHELLSPRFNGRPLSDNVGRLSPEEMRLTRSSTHSGKLQAPPEALRSPRLNSQGSSTHLGRVVLLSEDARSLTSNMSSSHLGRWLAGPGEVWSEPLNPRGAKALSGRWSAAPEDVKSLASNVSSTHLGVLLGGAEDARSQAWVHQRSSTHVGPSPVVLEDARPCTLNHHGSSTQLETSPLVPEDGRNQWRNHQLSSTDIDAQPVASEDSRSLPLNHQGSHTQVGKPPAVVEDASSLSLHLQGSNVHDGISLECSGGMQTPPTSQEPSTERVSGPSLEESSAPVMRQSAEPSGDLRPHQLTTLSSSSLMGRFPIALEGTDESPAEASESQSWCRSPREGRTVSAGPAAAAIAAATAAAAVAVAAAVGAGPRGKGMEAIQNRSGEGDTSWSSFGEAPHSSPSRQLKPIPFSGRPSGQHLSRLPLASGGGNAHRAASPTAPHSPLRALRDEREKAKRRLAENRLSTFESNVLSKLEEIQTLNVSVVGT